MTAHRIHRYRLGVIASGSSKVVAALSQLLVIPVAFSVLGEVRYGVMLAILALSQWITILGLGVIPSLTRELAEASTKDRQSLEKAIFGGGFWASLIISLSYIVVMIFLITVFGPLSILGITYSVDFSEILFAMYLASFLVALQLFASVLPAARAGYQETHVASLFALMGHIGTIVCVVAVSQIEPSVSLVLLAMTAPIPLMFLVDMVRLFNGRPYLWVPEIPRIDDLLRGRLRGLVRTSTAAWGAQLHSFLTMSLTVVLVSHWGQGGEVAAFGTMMRGVVIWLSVVGLFVFPAVPALADAWARGDDLWVHRNIWRMLKIGFVLAIVAGVAVSFFGSNLIELWLGEGLSITPLMTIGFGLYLFAWTLGFISYNGLLALGAVRGVAWLLIGQALLVIVVAAALQSRFSAADSVALALGSVTLMMASWILPVRLIKVIATSKHADPSRSL